MTALDFDTEKLSSSALSTTLSRMKQVGVGIRFGFGL